MALDREAILGMDDIKTVPVTVPEWGNEVVLVRGMTGAERDNFEASNQDKAGGQKLANLRARYLVRCIVNENGTRVFADQDAAALGKKSSAAINRLWDAAAELNGTSEEAQEETEGNSETDGTEGGSDSPSSSPATSE
jgi:hypothetical protein